MFGGAPAFLIRDLFTQDATAHGRIDGFNILIVRADIADMGEGEIDDLPRVGGVGQDFLITGHRCVEADFADGLGFRANSLSIEDRAIG